MHLHLDPVGGIAGDMFAAAMLDAWPELKAPLLAALTKLGAPPAVRFEVAEHHDAVLAGRRFHVAGAHSGDHRHAGYRDIRQLIEAAPLADAVKARAVAIFTLLAEAEGAVHGISAEEVSFHEVGQWDSIADVVAAAFLIDAIGAASWSVAPLPIGSGRVRTAHGELPLPAPAAAELLKDFLVIDDGRDGERITPTGAAILRHLAPAQGGRQPPRKLARSGIGFGTRRFEGISNVLRVLAFDSIAGADDAVAVVAFDIDDQTPEDLAVALDRLRAVPGIVDVVQSAILAKKGRLATAVRMLVQPASLQAAVDACFAETTTIGLRWHLAERATLPRTEVTVMDSDAVVRVKRAERAGDATVKAEIDDVAAAGGFSARSRRRQRAEALAEDKDD